MFHKLNQTLNFNKINVKAHISIHCTNIMSIMFDPFHDSSRQIKATVNYQIVILPQHKILPLLQPNDFPKRSETQMVLSAICHPDEASAKFKDVY